MHFKTMKSFSLTVWGVIGLFTLVIGTVVALSFTRPSHTCKLDPAEIYKIRNQLAEK
jgi:hypothetical protein